MAKFEIPTKDRKLFIQPNKGDVFGNLWSTFNMDFDVSQGKARVAPRLRINTDDTDDADLGVNWGFVRTSASGTDQWWAGCGAVLFKTAATDPSASFAQDAITDTPTTLSAASSDMVEFNGALIVSDTTDLNRLSTTWDNAWWLTTLAQSALTSGIAHPLCVSLKTNVLLIGDGNKLHTIDKNSNVKPSRVILGTEFEIIWIRSNYDGTYIGARNKIGGEAKCFFWDESAENYNRAFGLKSDMTFAGVIKNGIPYTVNGEGQLLKYTGSAFEEVAVFPVFQQINKRLKDGNTIIRSISRNGMAIIDDKIHINVASQINNSIADFMENFPSGIWTYNETQGLRHKYAFTLYKGTEIDYGSYIVSESGALVPTTPIEGLFLAGAMIFSSSTVEVDAIFYRDKNNSINKRGHFITSIFESSSFEDIFKDILLSFKRFRNSGDRIIIKYRAIKNVNYPIEAGGTWTSTTTFTASGSANLGSLANITAGDEVMILRGRGAGATAKISSVAEAGGTYTITIAEAILNASGTNQFMVSDWTEAATISTQGIERQGFDLDVMGTFIQLKIELRSVPDGSSGKGDSPELEKITINNSQEEII